MTDDDTDPLDGADIGETRSVTHEQTLHSINFAPDEFFGTDREAEDLHIADVELVEADDQDDFRDIRVEWQGDVTKHLPPRWDQQPGETATADRIRPTNIVGLVLGGLISVGVAVFLTNSLSATLQHTTVNGEPLAPLPVVPFTVVLGLLVALIAWASTVMPRRVVT